MGQGRVSPWWAVASRSTVGFHAASRKQSRPSDRRPTRKAACLSHPASPCPGSPCPTIGVRSSRVAVGPPERSSTPRGGPRNARTTEPPMLRPTRRDLLRFGLGTLAAAALPAACAAVAGQESAGHERPGPLRQPPQVHASRTAALVTGGDGGAALAGDWIPVPQNQPEQDVGEVKTLPRVALVADTTGQALVARRYATTALPGPDKTWSLEVSYEITCRRTRANWPAIRQARLPDYRKDRDYEQFTRAGEVHRDGAAGDRRAGQEAAAPRTGTRWTSPGRPTCGCSSGPSTS